VLNAIYDAIKIPMAESPASSERIWMLLQQNANRAATELVATS
jgi:hypothetical protein